MSNEEILSTAKQIGAVIVLQCDFEKKESLKELCDALAWVCIASKPSRRNEGEHLQNWMMKYGLIRLVLDLN